MEDEINISTTTTPKVNVIIPVFNGELFIEQAINSVYQQSFHDFCITVIDDGSTDNTLQVLAQFGNKIKVITQPNQGPGEREMQVSLSARVTISLFLIPMISHSQTGL